MVDRLEELLALLEDEEDKAEREDALAVTAVPAAPASRIETAETDAGETVSGKGGDEIALFEAEKMDWTLNAEVPPLERREKVMNGDDGAAEAGSAEESAAASWLDGLAEAVTGPNGSVVLRRPGAGDMELAELEGRAGRTGAAELDAVMSALTSEEPGLEELYRQAVQASRPAVQAAPVEQAGRTMRAEEPGRTAALTVDELDRAVRRDSRRYDGGMTIF